MVVSNTASNRKFRMKPNPNGSWDNIHPNFGIIKGLHLDMLEFAHRIKKGAPLIPEPSYSGQAHIDPGKPVKPENLPPPDSGTKPAEHEPEKSNDPQGDDHSDDDYSSYSRSSSISVKNKDFLNKFGATPSGSRSRSQTPSVSRSRSRADTPVATPKPKKEEKVPKYINIEKVKEEHVEEKKKEEDPQEIFIREEVERRLNIAALKKARDSGIDVGDINDDTDLATTRILRKTTDTQVSHNKSVSMNRFALMGIFLGVDQGASFITDKMKGYFQYQMDIMHIYDEYLEAIGESSITTYIQQLDPSIQLIGMIGLTTGGFYIFQNFVGEDKVKGAKLIASFFPGKAQIIEDITAASKKVKEEKKASSPEKEEKESPPKEKSKKRRGPSYKPEDINRAE